MKNEINIGYGENGRPMNFYCTADSIAYESSKDKGIYICENEEEYWLMDRMLNFGFKVLKESNEGKRINTILENVNSFFEKMGSIKHLSEQTENELRIILYDGINVFEKLSCVLENIYSKGFKDGREFMQESIKNILGING